jgi:DNA-binding transcriptional MerR regulator
MPRAAAGAFPLRMRDLVEATGASPGTIQFYAASGLLPAASKRGRTSVLYSSATVDRIHWIRAVQQELRLPLRAVRVVLETLGEVSVAELRTRLSLGEFLDREYESPAPSDPPPAAPDIAAGLASVGLVESARDGDLSASDRRLIELVAAMQRAGFSPQNGFTYDQLIVYRDSMRAVVREETRRIVEAARKVGAAEAGAMVERGLPAIEELLRFFHTQAIVDTVDQWRALVSAAGDEEGSGAG